MKIIFTEIMNVCCSSEQASPGKRSVCLRCSDSRRTFLPIKLCKTAARARRTKRASAGSQNVIFSLNEERPLIFCKNIYFCLETFYNSREFHYFNPTKVCYPNTKPFFFDLKSDSIKHGICIGNANRPKN